MYKMIIAPEGAAIPEDLRQFVVEGSDIIEKILGCRDTEKIATVNTRELQLIVEYRDLFDLDSVAVIGLQGAMYSTVWNTYVSTMNRTTLEAVRAKFREVNDDRSRSGQHDIVNPSASARRMRVVPSRVEGDDADESEGLS